VLARRFGTLARIVAVLAFLASFALLMFEGIPAGEGAMPGRSVTITHTTRSGCPTRCKEPEKDATKVTTVGVPPLPADTPSVLERAFDSDAGAVILRFLAALLTALLTAVAAEAFFSTRVGGSAPPEDEGTLARYEKGSPLSPKTGPAEEKPTPAGEKPETERAAAELAY
jgi:hypothetical protein